MLNVFRDLTCTDIGIPTPIHIRKHAHTCIIDSHKSHITHTIDLHKSHTYVHTRT